MRASARAFVGVYGADAADHLAEAAGPVDRLDDAELAVRSTAASALGAVEVAFERFEDGIRHLQRAIDVSRAAGQGITLASMLGTQADALATVGRLREAAELADAAVETARLSGMPRSWPGRSPRSAGYRSSRMISSVRARPVKRSSSWRSPARHRVSSWASRRLR